MKTHHERIDDIPLIIAYLIKKKVDVYFNAHISNHGNQNSLSNGEVAIIWLAYILSEGDHRKAHIRDWVSSRQMTLSCCIGKQIDVNNFTDDRLTRIIRRCSVDDSWQAFESDLAKETVSLISVDLFLEDYFENTPQNKIQGVYKLDGTSISGFHEVDENGLMHFGYSKDHRPDLPQVKLMNCTEGVTGCPIVSVIDKGNINDDCMYEPVLKRMRNVFNTENYLYCGDAKISVQKVRESMVKNREFYLCPLQLSNIKIRRDFDEWVTNAIGGVSDILQIYDGEEHLGCGYEFQRNQKSTDGSISWNERVLIIKSKSHFESEKKKYDKIVAKIVTNLSKIASKCCRTKEEAEALLNDKLRIEMDKITTFRDMFEVDIEIKEIRKTYERTEIRSRGKRSGNYETKVYQGVIKTVSLKQDIQELYLKKMGWRAYVTTVPEAALTFSGAYRYYRKTQYVIEQGFHMLKSKPIGVRPLYVWKEDQIKGLLRFMCLGVLILKLISLELMIALREKKEVLMGLTAGQPKRKTSKPTAVSIFGYFYRSNITLGYVQIDGQWHGSISKVPELCLKILILLGLNENIYSGLIEKKIGMVGL